MKVGTMLMGLAEPRDLNILTNSVLSAGSRLSSVTHRTSDVAGHNGRKPKVVHALHASTNEVIYFTINDTFQRTAVTMDMIRVHWRP